jgi:general stress protein CsbA
MDVYSTMLVYSIDTNITVLNIAASQIATYYQTVWSSVIDDIRIVPHYLIIGSGDFLYHFDLD